MLLYLLSLQRGFRLLAECPYTIVSIDQEHPDRNQYREQRNTHATQVIPHREKSGKHTGELQDRYGYIQNHRPKGDQQQPEQPSPTPSNPYHQDDKKDYQGEQKQGSSKGMAICGRSAEQQNVGVNS